MTSSFAPKSRFFFAKLFPLQFNFASPSRSDSAYVSERMSIDFLRFLPRILEPDYMSRAGPVSRAGVSLPGSRHVCQTQQKSTSRLHDNRAPARLAEIPVSRCRDPG